MSKISLHDYVNGGEAIPNFNGDFIMLSNSEIACRRTKLVIKRQNISANSLHLSFIDGKFIDIAIHTENNGNTDMVERFCMTVDRTRAIELREAFGDLVKLFDIAAK